MSGLRRVVLSLVAGIALVFEGALLLLSIAFLLKYWENLPLGSNEISPLKGLVITAILLVSLETIRQKIKGLLHE